MKIKIDFTEKERYIIAEYIYADILIKQDAISLIDMLHAMNEYFGKNTSANNYLAK